MKVFICIPWFLPAFRAGGPIQSIANLITHVSNIEYMIFCGDTDLNNKSLAGIKKNEWTHFNNYTQVWYADRSKRSDAICKEIEHIKPDVLFMVGLFSWHFNIVPLLFAKASRKIVSPRGMLHRGALSQKKLKKRLFLTGLHMWGMEKKVIFHATNKTEEHFIKNEFGLKAKTFVANNFSKRINEQLPLNKLKHHIHIVTIALISPMKNHMLVLQSLLTTNAFIQYNIYGPIKDEAYWQSCIEVIKLLPDNVKVIFHGEMAPNQIEKVLSQNHVFIMPSKSENFGHAIIEALSAGKPVITSHNTPWNDLGQHKAGINVNNTIEEVAEAIEFFAEMDNETYNTYATGAGEYARNALKTSENIINYKRMFFEGI